MRIPDPKANTTTEAYLAYKAGYLEENELKPVLYEPYLHFDGWLAYWAGLTETYPNKGPGKNQMPQATANMTASGGRQTQFYMSLPAGTYTISFDLDNIEFGTGSSFSISMGIFGAGGTQIADVSLISITSSTTPGRKYKTFTISSDGTTDNRDNIRIPATDWNNGARAMLSNIQIEAGSTATEYEPYTIVPEMLTDEEALVAYLSGVTNTYPEEIKDPYDVRIVGYLKHLVSARWGRPEYPVNNEEFYLSTMKPPVVTNDTPSADIELDDTAEAPFIDVKAYGDTSQTTYTGKNLADAFGGTWVKSNAENELIDGVYKMTANSRVIARVVLQLGGLVEGETYTLSFYSRGVTVASDAGWTYARVREGQGGGEWISDRSVIAASDDYVKCTITFTANSVSDPWVWFYVAADNRNTNNIEIYIKDIQLEAGSTATSYEPYTGGVPAPNPDYPQPVNVVTGRQIVGVRSKNLFYLPDTETRNGVTFTKNPDGTFDLFGVPSANTNFSIVVGSKLESGEYTLSRNTGNFNIAVQDYSSSGWLTQLLTLNNASSSTGSINPVGTRTGFVVQAKSGVSYDLKNIQIQLEKGSSDTDFVPYAKENYEINLGKNLANAKLLGSGRVNNLNYSVLDDGSVRIVGTSTSSTHISLQYKIPQSLLGKSLVQSWSGDFSNVGNVSLKKSAGDIEGITTLTKDRSSATFVVTQSMIDEVDNVDFWVSSGKTVDATIKYQLEIGDTATSYSPYFEPIELCKLGDYQDYIYRDADGDWYLHKATEKSIITAITSLYYSAGEGYIGGQVGKDSMASNSRRNGYCNILNTLQTPSNATEEGITFGASNKIIYIVLNDTRMESSTKTNWDNWLSSNNVIVYYPLETATDNLITNSELISQLDALVEGGSYEGKTYIKVNATDPNLPALLKVEAGEYD